MNRTYLTSPTPYTDRFTEAVVQPDNSFDEDYINGWNNCLAEQREALTRLEKEQ